jgi:uncharacterized low-complexity protein
MDGVSEEGRWLSYAELAELRGISKSSATRMSFRHKWRRQSGNDGTVRVFVPTAAFRDKSNGTDMEAMSAAIEAVTVTFWDQVEAERTRANAAEARADQERARADVAEQRRQQVQAELQAAQAEGGKCARRRIRAASMRERRRTRFLRCGRRRRSGEGRAGGPDCGRRGVGIEGMPDPSSSESASETRLAEQLRRLERKINVLGVIIVSTAAWAVAFELEHFASKSFGEPFASLVAIVCLVHSDLRRVTCRLRTRVSVTNRSRPDRRVSAPAGVSDQRLGLTGGT